MKNSRSAALQPDLAQIRKHLETIAVPREVFKNPAKLSEIESYIENYFRSLGYQVEKRPFKLEVQLLNNLVARKADSDAQKPRFIIGAHFDSVAETPGADDNASGMAALLEAARLFATAESNAPVDFIAFNAEEQGLIGSTDYVQALKKQKTRIAGMISLEMIGFTNQQKGSQQLPPMLRPFYPDVGNFLALVGDGSSGSLLKKAKEIFKQVEGLPVEALSVPMKGMILPETRLSDHSPFWDAGYPALLVTDTSFFRNPHYHTPEDRIETLDLEFLCRVTEGVARFALAV